MRGGNPNPNGENTNSIHQGGFGNQGGKEILLNLRETALFLRQRERKEIGLEFAVDSDSESDGGESCLESHGSSSSSEGEEVATVNDPAASQKDAFELIAEENENNAANLNEIVQEAFPMRMTQPMLPGSTVTGETTTTSTSTDQNLKTLHLKATLNLSPPQAYSALIPPKSIPTATIPNHPPPKRPKSPL